jgi:tyrosyl-tRNA synthetase
MAVITDSKKIEELVTRGVAETIDQKSLLARLRSGKVLRVKLGIDPTSPHLHLGRSIPLLKLRDFQQLGHKIVFIVGDFTAVIGDTSDKDSERPMLTTAQVKSNLKTYLQQAGKIIDLKKAEIRYNSEWFGKLTYAQIGEQANVFSLAEFMARENISKRYKEGKRISLREILYPLMQGYDSVMVKADVELGGTDQRFNLLAGRQLQQHYNQKPQDLIMNNLIEGLDGRKMSSSWGNTINLTDSAKDIFGKIMRLRDESIITYLVHCTRVPMSEVEQQKKALSQGTNPRDIKLFLAEQLVTFYYDTKTAKAERDSFLHQFSDRQMPTDIPLKKLVNLTGPFPDKLYSLGLTTSKSEARRLLEQGAVKINGDKIIFDKGYTVELKIGDVIQVGKRKFIKLVK